MYKYTLTLKKILTVVIKKKKKKCLKSSQHKRISTKKEKRKLCNANKTKAYFNARFFPDINKNTIPKNVCGVGGECKEGKYMRRKSRKKTVFIVFFLWHRTIRM